METKSPAYVCDQHMDNRLTYATPFMQRVACFYPVLGKIGVHADTSRVGDRVHMGVYIGQ